jgi:hypothetical protein
VVGGIVPLFAPALFNTVGYGRGFTIFACAALALAPAPPLFYRYGERLRRKFAIQL